jgi:hypothetical protein
MKTLLLSLIFGFMVVAVSGQKKKDIQSHKIKSITVTNEGADKPKGKPVLDMVTKYDESGNTIEEIEYDESGKVKKHIKSEFDEDGNKIKETEFKPDGTKDKIFEYKYRDGLKIERISYLPNGKVKSRKKYTYEYH